MSWKTTKLNSLCQIQSGGTPRRNNATYWERGNIPWVKISDMNSPDGMVITTEECITKAGLESIGNRVFPAGTILLAMYGSVGKTAVAKTDLTTNQAILGIQNKRQEKLDSRFLLRWLESIQKDLEHSAKGVTQKNISATMVRNLQIPLPPLAEQQRIAAILDKADGLRAKRRAALAKLDALLQSTFLHMFGDPVTNPMGWTVVTVGSLSTHIGSGATPRGGSSVYEKEGVLFIRSQNVLMFDFDFSDVAYIAQNIHDSMQRSKLKSNDVLLNITGASIGRVNYYRGLDYSANVNQHVCIIRPKINKVQPEYLTYHLGMPSYQSKILGQNAGATRQAFNFKQIREFRIMLPPLSDQQRFVNAVRKLKSIRGQQIKAVNQLDNLFHSLQQRAFKGEL